MQWDHDVAYHYTLLVFAVETGHFPSWAQVPLLPTVASHARSHRFWLIGRECLMRPVVKLCPRRILHFFYKITVFEFWGFEMVFPRLYREQLNWTFSKRYWHFWTHSIDHVSVYRNIVLPREIILYDVIFSIMERFRNLQKKIKTFEKIRSLSSSS